MEVPKFGSDLMPFKSDVPRVIRTSEVTLVTVLSVVSGYVAPAIASGAVWKTIPVTSTLPGSIVSVNESTRIPLFKSRLDPVNSGSTRSDITLVACKALPSVIGALSIPSGLSMVLARRVM